MSSSKPNVLVLGVEHPRDAAVIRSLASAGIAVDVADDKTPPTAMWRSSRLIRNKYLLPESGEKALLMLEALGLPKDTVLIPTNDQYLILVSKNFELLWSSPTGHPAKHIAQIRWASDRPASYVAGVSCSTRCTPSRRSLQPPESDTRSRSAIPVSGC